MDIQIRKKMDQLNNHSLYRSLADMDSLKCFMQYHVFAVWDFMSLLKSLQQKITCVSVPWLDSDFDPRLVRLVNEIVVGEESDLDPYGNPMSHFEMYKNAMIELDANTKNIEDFLGELNFSKLPKELAEVVAFHIDLALNGSVHEIAAAFFFGREKLIPEMFEEIVKILKANQLVCPYALYYFERHIELDANEHGPMAEKCVEILGGSEVKRQQMKDIAIKSLEMRNRLWNFIESEIQKTKSSHLLKP
ncbi:MAG: DUF3050 domain-containing protein [Bdellovibrionota bacterium]|nr:DUF3050 domain-containing protein [Bdellovibrionota bacterium]